MGLTKSSTGTRLLENKFDVLKKYILENWREENE